MKKYAFISFISLIIGFSIGRISNNSDSNPTSIKSRLNPHKNSLQKDISVTKTTQDINKSPATKTKNIQLKLSQVYNLPVEDQEREFELLLERHPHSWRHLEAYSNSLIYNGHVNEKTENLLIRCLQEKKTSELCQSNLTNYYVETDQLQKASHQTKECLKLLPKSMSCLNNYTTESLRKKDYAKALELFLKMEKYMKGISH